MPVIGGGGVDGEGGGLGTPQVNSASLNIRGGPDTEETMPLRIGPQFFVDGNPDLFIAGPEANFMPLRIGNDFFGSGNAVFYVEGREAFGGTFFEDRDTTLYIKAIDNSGSGIQNGTPTLRILGPDTASINENTTLRIKADIIPPVSGVVTTYVSGANPTTSNPILQDANTTLYIRNTATDNNNTTLHIETDFNLGDTTTLFIKDVTPNVATTLHVSGVGFTSEQAPLYIQPPEDEITTLYLTGFSE